MLVLSHVVGRAAGGVSIGYEWYQTSNARASYKLGSAGASHTLEVGSETGRWVRGGR
jgi:hypothetical protein